MTQNVDLEIRVIKKFIDKTKQERYISFISVDKNRRRFVKALPHFNHFKWNLFDKIKGHEKQLILTTLQQNKVSDRLCYAISENSNIDARTLNVEDAINETLSSDMGTILVFGKGELIFYKGEEPNSSFISKYVNSMPEI
jgi:hypothetical protein